MLDKIAGLSWIQIDLLTMFLLLEGVAVAAVPEEIILLSLGLLWGQGRVGFFDSLIAAQLGLLPANFLMVLFGNKFGRRILQVPPFSWIFREKILEKAMGHVHRHSSKTIFVTRFTPAIRGPVYLAVGISRVPLLKFIKIDALASFIHIPLLLIIGRAIGQSVPIEVVYKIIFGAALIGLAITSMVFAFDFLTRNKHKRLLNKSLINS